MTTLLRDLLISLNERVSSPIFLAFVIAFVSCNWDPILYLFLSDEFIGVRIDYVHENASVESTLLRPISLAVLISVALPWLKYCSIWFAEIPLSKTKQIRDTHKVDHNIFIAGLKAKELQENVRLEEARAREEAERANRLVERSKRKSDALEKGDEELLEQLDELYSSTPNLTAEEIRADLSKEERITLAAFGLSDDALTIDNLVHSVTHDLVSFRETFSNLRPNMTDIRLKSELEPVIKRLNEIGLLSKNGSTFRLTKLGYEVFDIFFDKERKA